MKKINIGIIGLGTIGRGVLRILSQKRDFFKKKFDVDFNIVKVCDKNPKLRNKLGLKPKVFTTEFRNILSDKNVDIMVELIGGINPAKDIIISALESGKDVVTANKALLAADLKSILNTAYKNKAHICFEASVGGGIPIIKALREGLIANKIESVISIINGTCNYILSKMQEEGCSFFEALQEAKKKGFAERNPSLDIKGFDSAHKLAILTYLSFGRYVSLDEMFIKGIEDISPLDVQYAKELGLVIKLLAIAKKVDKDMLDIRVHPTLIPKSHPLASVSGVFNAIYLKGELVGDMLFFGQGAGQLPTASAIISDLVDLACQKSIKDYKPMVSTKGIKKVGDIRSKFYMRFMVIDKPGVLAKISGILSRHKISISSVSQKEKSRARVVPVVMLTHDVRERDMQNALADIDKLSFIKKSTVVIHREEI